MYWHVFSHTTVYGYKFCNNELFLCLSGLNTGMFTDSGPLAPITNAADLTTCEHLCDNNDLWCQRVSYNSATQTCTLQSQLVPVSPVASVVTFASCPSMYNISPGQLVLCRLYGIRLKIILQDHRLLKTPVH